MIKSNGPSIEPWGTPVVIGSCPDFTPFISTYCDLFVEINGVKSGQLPITTGVT